MSLFPKILLLCRYWITVPQKSLLESHTMLDQTAVLRQRIGSDWENGNVLVKDYWGSLARADWRPGQWSATCIRLSASKAAQHSELDSSGGNKH